MRWLVAVGLLAAFVTFLSGHGPVPPHESFCAGVGLLTDTYGATPREALEAYVRSRGGEPTYWKLKGTAFEIVDERARPRGFASISAARDDKGVWRADGACVGNYGPPKPTHRFEPRSSTTCEALELTVGDGRNSPPMKTWEFLLTNVGSASCVVEGYPMVSLKQNSYGLSFGFKREEGALVAASEPQRVELRPRETAYFVIEKDACAASTPPGVDHVAISFGNTDRSEASMPTDFAYCTASYSDDFIVQSPVVADLADAYRAAPGLMRCRAKDFAPDGVDQNPVAWRVRLAYNGVSNCEWRGGGTGVTFGNVFGLTYKQADTPPFTVPRRGTLYLSFDKPACVKPEASLTGGSLRIPGGRGSIQIPVPTGLEKCDFKETAANIIRWRIDLAT